jgi:hypothetical protein
MSTILKIAAAMILITASVQGGRAALKHYTFVDSLQESMLFGGSLNEEEIADRVIELAADHEIPLNPDLMSVKRDPFLITIEAPYTDTVNLLPGFYARAWDFETSVSVRLLEDTRRRGTAQGGRRRR